MVHQNLLGSSPALTIVALCKGGSLSAPNLNVSWSSLLVPPLELWRHAVAIYVDSGEPAEP